MKTKQLLTCILFLLFCFVYFEANAQQAVSFEYDTNGQMTKRTLTVKRELIEQDSVKEELLFTKIQIYPNPTSTGLNITHSFVEEMPENMKLYDMNGKLLYTQNKTIENHEWLELGEYEAGIYLLQMTYQGKPLQWKILKQ